MQHYSLKDLTVYNTLNGIFERKTISLYDFMKKANAGILAHYMERLEMHGFAFADIAHSNELTDASKGEALPILKDEMLNMLNGLSQLCKAYNLVSTMDYIQVVLRQFDIYYNSKTLPQQLDAIQVVLKNDLNRTLFFILSQEEKDMYESAEITAKSVGKKLPSIIINLEEGLKSLALSNYTSSVAHFMRAIEYSVERLGVAAGIDLYRHDIKRNRYYPKNWGDLLAGVDDKLDKFKPSINTKAKSVFFSDAERTISHLYLVKTMRNDVAHPKRHFTKEDAVAAWSETKSYISDMMLIQGRVKKYLKPLP